MTARTTWKTDVIQIACGTGNDVAFWSAVEAQVFGGLAVHRTAHMPWTRARWSVTHVPTGRHVSTANTERLARRFVRTVAPLVDWETRTDLKGLPGSFWDQMRAALLAAHDGDYIGEIRL